MKEPDPKKAKNSTAMTSGTSTSGKTHAAVQKLPKTFVPPEAKPDDPHVPVLEVPIDQKPKDPNITFDKTPAQISAYCAVLAAAGIESSSSSEHISPSHPHLTKIPNPRSNYEHMDPPPANAPALLELPLDEQEPYQRLKLAFDWLICRISPLLEDINQALKDDNVVEYITARKAYVEFVGNLNNHYPKPEPPETDIKKGFGYGKNLKQNSIEALIGWDNAINKNVIIGARIQVEWNPHLSSSGVPIPH